MTMLETAVFDNGYGENKIFEIETSRKVLDVLIKHYGGHNWFVDCTADGKWVTIQLMYGSAEQPKMWKWGYGLNMLKLVQGDADYFNKTIMRAGGEILERFGKARRAVRANDDMVIRKIDIIGAV